MNNPEQGVTHVNSFNFDGQAQPVSFVETMKVRDGVECDVYTVDNDPTKDLGIIRIQPGRKTPLQKVLQGDKTIEGYISGKGKLTVTKTDGTEEVHTADASKEPLSVTVQIGELMQWEADPTSNLTAYEVCYPPYQDGRYEDLE